MGAKPDTFGSLGGSCSQTHRRRATHPAPDPRSRGEQRPGPVPPPPAATQLGWEPGAPGGWGTNGICLPGGGRAGRGEAKTHLPTGNPLILPNPCPGPLPGAVRSHLCHLLSPQHWPSEDGDGYKAPEKEQPPLTGPLPAGTHPQTCCSRAQGPCLVALDHCPDLLTPSGLNPEPGPAPPASPTPRSPHCPGPGPGKVLVLTHVPSALGNLQTSLRTGPLDTGQGEEGPYPSGGHPS